jgi:hypothetical protein
MSDGQAMRLLAEGCVVAACWAPLLCVSGLLLFVGVRATSAGTVPPDACPVPLVPWALVT